MIYDSRSLALNVICVSFTLLTGLLTTWNSLPNWVVTANNSKVFKNDLINIGNIMILYLGYWVHVRLAVPLPSPCGVSTASNGFRVFASHASRCPQSIEIGSSVVAGLTTATNTPITDSDT